MRKFLYLTTMLGLFILNGCSTKKEAIVVSNDKGYILYNLNDNNTGQNVYEQVSSLNSVDENNINTEHLHILNFHWLHNHYGKLYSIVKKDGKYGIINDEGKFIVKPTFEFISKLYNDFFIIKEDGKYGYLNDDFKVVQKPIYLDAKEFSNGIAFVKFSNEKWGCISDDMKVLLYGKFDGIFPFINSFARVINDDKWGFINSKCEIIVEPKYNYVNNFCGDTAKVLLNDKVGYINNKGKEIVSTSLVYGQNLNE
ncbi:WG repeat-containing protein [Arcobacter sp.]|uniref:WG repeat-containing protein n=1 Tax=Arcobacter sp. TaxID=1872629 RepID=UPI003D09BEC4